ncbi:S8 family serine peptidase [Kribbella sp. NPDC023855]|uniref:S8 family serine peptidase n=1 Tax=Kribbella sp. NPDC023855 TaxID=3154698 RepID=UPI0033C4B6DD
MRLLRRTAPLVVAALAAFAVTAATASAGSAVPEPEGHVVSVAKKPVAGTYLVTLAPGRQAVATAAATERAASALADRYDGRLGAVLTKTMRGFVVRDLSEQQARRLAAHPDVAEVRQSGTARIGDATGPGGTQNNPPNWGLDRIDQRDRPLDSKYTYPNDGAGVTAYIVDTGIRYTHQEFEGRAKFGADFHATPNQGNDCHNHGTHVAGIVAGSTRGVAKKANLVSVRILGCDGFGVDADLVEAAEWIAQNAVKPAVANLSVYTDDPDIAVSAIRGSIVNAGVQWSLITGNNGGNACKYGPGGQMTEALTVGNSTNQDTRASDSNAGSCMDLWAPGSGINSAFRGSDSAYGTLSGTSMAAPHVAGAMALRLHDAPSSTPAQLHQWVMDNASTGKMSGIPSDAPNKLVYVPNTPPATDDFSLAANPTAVSVDPGSSVTTTIATTVTRGAAQTVQLSAGDLPSGVTASFDPASVTAGNSSRLTLTAAAAASPARATVTVTGKGTAVTRTTNVGLTVNGDVPDDFSLSTDPSSGTVTAGNSVTTTVRATATSVAPANTGQSKTAMREESSAGPGSGVGVVGGTLTTVSKYPFIISQHRTGGARPTEQSCTGSVVAPRKVLIAAHCKFAEGEKYLIYGRDDLADTSKGVRIAIQEYLTHPNYNANDGWRTGYDVAVITTISDIPTPAGMAYPAVAKSGDTLALGTRGTAIGYGKSDSQDAQRNTKLYEAVLPTVDGQNCGSYSGHFDDRYMMCSGYASGGPSLCQGDSGGPYLYNGKIYGVFSWLRTDCATYQAHGKLWGVMGDWANEQLGTTEPPTGEVNLTAGGLPSGTIASFSPTKIAVGGSSQLTITTSASTPAGDYTITVNGTRDAVSRQTTYRLTVNGGTTTLTLTDPGVQTSVRGRPVTLQLKASGGTGGNRFTATGLPAGLSINQSTGLITGTPTVATNYRPTVRVTDTSGATASATFYWFIFPY